jgi:hypothetical protein
MPLGQSKLESYVMADRGAVCHAECESECVAYVVFGRVSVECA